MSANPPPPPGKEYLCFQTDGKSDRAIQCARSRVLNKVIDTIFDIDSFEQKYVIIKGLLKSKWLK